MIDQTNKWDGKSLWENSGKEVKEWKEEELKMEARETF
jgi:hypothetical protein